MNDVFEIAGYPHDKVNNHYRYVYDLCLSGYFDLELDGCSIASRYNKKDAFSMAKKLTKDWQCNIIVKSTPRNICKLGFKALMDYEPKFVKEFKYG